MSALKRFLQPHLLRCGITIGKRAEHQAVVDFISSVRPYKTDHQLIRIGGPADGGYLIPDDLEGIKFCFSPGVSSVADFENDLARRGIKCFLADASVKQPPIENPLFNFERKHIGVVNNERFMTLERWVELKAPNETDFILQMDIEGAEYKVLLDTDDGTLRKFRVMVIEFHNFGYLYDRLGCELFTSTFNKILRAFDVVHIHPNNCSASVDFNGLQIPPVLEFTFLRKDRVLAKTPSCTYPHRLDRKNVARRKDLALPACWYR